MTHRARSIGGSSGPAAARISPAHRTADHRRSAAPHPSPPPDTSAPRTPAAASERNSHTSLRSRKPALTAPVKALF